MAERPTIRYGTEILGLTEVTSRLLMALLRRLPPSLYSQDLADNSLQQMLLHPDANALARWFESWTTARQMTLLQEALGADLDRLMADYGLRRFNQRPDAYARFVVQRILWKPRGTLAAVVNLADLLLAQPHSTQRSGRQQWHTWVASTHPATAALTFWTLTALDGTRWALFVWQGGIITSPLGPPGIDVTPDTRPLAWVRLPDPADILHYLQLDSAGQFVVSDIPPVWGHGSDAPVEVLDGAGTRWQIRLDGSLLPTPVFHGAAPPYVISASGVMATYCVLLDATATPWYVSMPHGAFVVQSTPPPGTDVTPPGGPFSWLRARSQDGNRFALQPNVNGLTMDISPSDLAGRGTLEPRGFGTAEGVQWRFGVDASGPNVITSDTPPVDLQNAPTCYVLYDRAGVRWLWQIDPADGSIEVSDFRYRPVLPQTPMGEVAWLQIPVYPPVPHYWALRDTLGVVWYLFMGTPPTLNLSSIITPLGVPIYDGIHVQDVLGQTWYLTVSTGGELTIDRGPPSGTILTALAGVPFQSVAGSYAILSATTVGERLLKSVDLLTILPLVGDPIETRYLFPDIDGTPSISDVAPPQWGLPDTLRLWDEHSVAWLVDSDGLDNTLRTQPLVPPSLMPPPDTRDVIYLRDCFEACEHVHAAGTLPTMRVF